jgi:dTDP-4-dehydrorhamnose reductase
LNRVLITGGSGLLGLNWAAATRSQSEVHLGIHFRKVSLRGTVASPIDINSLDCAVRYLDLLQPDLVVHAAGLTSVEQCEANYSLAFHQNVTLARNISQACNKLHIKLVHISTDHLFEGFCPFIDEGATPHPRNVYGKTKAEAELAVLQSDPNSLVIRTNFFGWGTSYRSSFSDYIVQSLRSGRPIKLFEDVFYTPILAESLALIAAQLVGINQSGVVNLGGDTRISKFDFGVRLAEAFGLDKSLISPVKFVSRSDLVTRPLDMSLSNKYATTLLGAPGSSLDSDILRLRQQEEQGLAKELSVL